MHLLARIFGRTKPRPAPVLQRTRPAGLGVTATRAQLVRMAHRDTLRRHGIPENWVAIEAIAARDSRGSLGVHARLVVKNVDSSLLTHLPQVLQLIRVRLGKLDHSSEAWLCGSSVRFELPVSHAFEPLPPAGFWEEARRRTAGAPPEAEADSGAREGTRDWLDRMFSGNSTRHTHTDFRPTQPMYGQQEA